MRSADCGRDVSRNDGSNQQGIASLLFDRISDREKSKFGVVSNALEQNGRHVGGRLGINLNCKAGRDLI